MITMIENISKSMELLKIIKEYQIDPCHYLFKESLEKLADELKDLNMQYDYRLVKGILNSFKIDYIIPIAFKKNMNIILKHLKEKKK